MTEHDRSPGVGTQLRMRHESPVVAHPAPVLFCSPIKTGTWISIFLEPARQQRMAYQSAVSVHSSVTASTGPLHHLALGSC